MIFSEGVQAAIGGVADQVPAVMSALAAGEKVFQLMALKPKQRPVVVFVCSRYSP